MAAALQPDSGGASLRARFSGADLFRLEAATDPQISPDGSRLAYVRRSGDVMSDRFRSSILVVDVASHLETTVAAGADNASSPRWSNDGSKLAFLSSPPGVPPKIIVSSPAAPGAVVSIAVPSGASAIAWAPDGRSIAFTAFVPAGAEPIGLPAKPRGATWAPALRIHDRLIYRSDDQGYLRPGFVHLFTVPTAGGPPRQLTFGEANDSGPLSWTPDSRRILFAADRDADWERRANKSRIYAVDVGSLALQALTGDGAWRGEPAISPDGKWIAFTAFADDGKDYHSSQLFVMDAAGGTARSLTPTLDRTVLGPIWSSDSRSLYVGYDDHGLRKVARVGLDGELHDLFGGLAGALLDRPYTGGTFSVARSGAIAAMTGSWSRPPDVSIFNRGRLRRLTALNAFLASTALGVVRPLQARADGGPRIESWLTLPPSYRPGIRLPLILEIHGGPHQAYGPFFSFDDQLYAASGFAVLSANPRGSTSYGEAFTGAIFKDYPGPDYADLMAAVDAAVAAGYADPERLFVTGGSGGGLLAAWVIGKTGRFRAAAVQKPIINMASFMLTSDQPAYYERYWFAAAPWDDPAAYWSRSPLSLAGQMRTPTMVVIGDRDYRTPASEAEQLYTALKLRDVPAVLVEVPGANHSGLSSRPSQAAARVGAIIGWFRRFDPKP